MDTLNVEWSMARGLSEKRVRRGVLARRDHTRPIRQPHQHVPGNGYPASRSEKERVKIKVVTKLLRSI